MKKIYTLSSCNTCKNILTDLAPPSSFIIQDIKQDPISEEQLEEMYQYTNSYEELFSKRARLYKERDLKNKNLKEADYRNLILEHYTFLKRPVIINNDRIFVGNSKKTIAEAKESIDG